MTKSTESDKQLNSQDERNFFDTGTLINQYWNSLLAYPCQGLKRFMYLISSMLGKHPIGDMSCHV